MLLGYDMFQSRIRLVSQLLQNCFKLFRFYLRVAQILPLRAELFNMAIGLYALWLL